MLVHKTDYEHLRDETEFTWYVGSAYTAALELTGIPIKDVSLDPQTGIELYRKARPLLRDMFGPDVRPLPVSTPAVSYGHINCLGAELMFPDDGEVNHGRLCESLQDAVEILKKPVDFSQAGMMPFYLDYLEQMRKAFPGEQVKFAFKSEGPITTAYTIRRDDFFYDLYDNPELTKEFLRLITESIIEYDHFLNQAIRDAPEINPGGYELCDDIASMISPKLWREMVIPYIDQRYQGLTPVKRTAHMEDLRPDHLPFLEELGLVFFDPSISPQINPKIIRERCRVPFAWRLGNFHYRYLSVQDVTDFVFQATADGASTVFTIVGSMMCNEETVPKVKAFIDACKECDRMLKKGATREEIGCCVTPEGRRKFWDHWLD